MSKTYRRCELDDKYGCLDGYIERQGSNSFTSLFPDRAEHWNAWDKKYWSRRNRDGKSGEYHRGGGKSRKYYRDLTNKLIRRETQRKIAKCIRDDDWDDAVYPTQWDGKKFIWSVW
jgi:hypothetical protein